MSRSSLVTQSSCQEDCYVDMQVFDLTLIILIVTLIILTFPLLVTILEYIYQSLLLID